MNAPVEAGLNPYVLSETQGGVRTLTMNRGERFNALSREMLEALERAIDDAGADPRVRAVVIAGNGKGFCAGHDLKELRAHEDPAWQPPTSARAASTARREGRESRVRAAGRHRSGERRFIKSVCREQLHALGSTGPASANRCRQRCRSVTESETERVARCSDQTNSRLEGKRARA